MNEGYRLLEQGERLMAENRLDEAIERFRRFLDDFPEDADGQYQLGIALYEKGELDEALLRFYRARNLDPTDAKPYDGIALVLMEKGDFAGAVEYYHQALSRDPENVDLMNEMGIAYQEMGEEDKALEIYSMAIELEPNFGYPYYNRARLLVSIGRFDEAIKDLERSISLYKGEREKLKDVLFELAGVYEDIMDDTKALEVYGEILMLDLECVEALVNIGSIHLDNCDYEKAAAYFERLIRIDPENDNAYLEKGYALGCMGDTDKELEYLEKCLSINPANKYALSNKGAALLEKGHFEEAERCFRHAIEVDRDYSWPYYNLACLFSLRGEKALCLSYLRKAMEMDPALKEDARRDSCLERMHGYEAFRKLIE
ncbi:MAG: tetratricopeptide repeat protein [Actinomycetota bacterium]|nr:tetratricopeptide repeat protein [Actinomycetota bacterium]